MDQPPMERALSTDLVVDVVMKHLKVRDLLNCRLVSKCWKKAASSALRRRSTMIKQIYGENQLMELEECMEQSSDFPFAGLKFHQPWTLRTARAMKFFEDYGDRFTRLCLDEKWTIRLQDLAPFINHLSRLSILIQGSSWRPCLPVQAPVSTAGPEEGQILKLSSLRTIRLLSPYPEVNEDVLRQVFKAASSSELRIECLDASYRILGILKNVGKLHAISVLNANEPVRQCDWTFDLWSTEPPALTKLDLQKGGCISREWLMKLLISSQHTLKELRLVGICPYELSAECPVLPNLTTLSLWIDRSWNCVFQQGQGHKFPALKELTIDTEPDVPNLNISDGLFIVPSVTRIELEGYIDKDGIEDLARRFPNVTDIRLNHKPYDFEGPSWQRDPTYIWSVGAFKLLEKLKIWNYIVEPPASIIEKLKYPIGSIDLEKFKVLNMDSFLTGISFATCEILRKHPQQNLMGSPFNEILRDSPNLLQLKNLKELIVCVRLEDGRKKFPGEPPFISMVSMWYALEMMPKLTAKFVYDHSRPASNFDGDREKAVTMLKDAFKHVQSHVQLEPFFY